MPMHNLIEYNDSFSKTSGSFQQYQRDQPHNIAIVNSESFKSKTSVTDKAPTADNKEYVEIAVKLKYLSSLWRTL